MRCVHSTTAVAIVQPAKQQSTISTNTWIVSLFRCEVSFHGVHYDALSENLEVSHGLVCPYIYISCEAQRSSRRLSISALAIRCACAGISYVRILSRDLHNIPFTCSIICVSFHVLVSMKFPSFSHDALSFPLCNESAFAPNRTPKSEASTQ